MEAMRVHRRVESGFVDMVLVIFFIEKAVSIEPVVIRDLPFPIPYGFVGPDFFLGRLKALSERGWVYRDVGMGRLVLGQMKKCDNKWNWVAFTAEEAEAANMSHFR